MSRHYVQEFREFVKQTPYGTTYDWLQYINAENKQGNITADECRVIIDALNLKSYEGGRKVLIMWRPEYLGKEGNILLKLIEEPPADTLMIFVAENTEDILQTIRSRTQDVRLAPIPAADIAQALISRANTDPTQAAQIAQIAMGSYSEALRLVRHADNDLFQEARQLFNCLFLHNGVGIAKLAEDWSKIGREQQKNLLQYLLQLMEHTIRVRFRPETVNTLPAAEAALVQKLATAKISHEGLSQMAGHLSDTCFYIERNAHAKTQLLALMIRLHSIIRSIPAAVAQ
jgi:DNA polymerase-3 subunit delta'